MSLQICDSHIHLGRSLQGEPVKIGAGSRLTLQRVMPALREYGAGIGCVVDLATRRGLRDLEELLRRGALAEQADGSFGAPQGVRIVGALEAEFRLPPAGPFHLLAYVPGLDALRALADLYAQCVRNPDLSTQRVALSPEEFRGAVEGMGGVTAVAHAFTPHRGLIGVGLTPADAFRDTRGVGMELGLSADVRIARRVGAIGGLGLIGGSDAHGPQTVGREVNEMEADSTGFALVSEMVRRGADRIYGMNPAFGKYHRSYCPRCGTVLAGEAPQLQCPRDSRHRIVVGVLDRAHALGEPSADRPYPQYRYQLPLPLLPGFGPKARARLVARFGTLHSALHEAPVAQIADAIGEARARVIAEMRRGALPAAPGGGGLWGRAPR